jgi:hypothetical protein
MADALRQLGKLLSKMIKIVLERQPQCILQRESQIQFMTNDNENLVQNFLICQKFVLADGKRKKGPHFSPNEQHASTFPRQPLFSILILVSNSVEFIMAAAASAL